MSKRLFGSFVSTSLRSVLFSATALTMGLGLGGCGAPAEGTAQRQALISPMCPDAPGSLLFHDGFEDGLGNWRIFTSDPRQDGHTWAAETCHAYAGSQAVRSDPDGKTVANYYNRMDSRLISLVGKKDARLRFAARYKVSDNGIFQVFVASPQSGKRSLIADFNGKNAGYPGYEVITLPIPNDFLGEEVEISFLMQAGPNGCDYGALIDEVDVLAESLPPGNAVLFDDFEGDLSKWTVYSDPGVAGHVWAQENSTPGCPGSTVARSDLAGETRQMNYTRLESNPFSLVGKSGAEIMVDAKYKLAPGDRYQVFVAEMDRDDHRTLVAEFQGQNASFPGLETQTFAVPADFLGLPRVRLAFLALTGENGIDYGIALDNVKVTTTP